MVPMAGLEPARLAPLPPQDSVSTKFHHIGTVCALSQNAPNLTQEFLRLDPIPVQIPK